MTTIDSHMERIKELALKLKNFEETGVSHSTQIENHQKTSYRYDSSSVVHQKEMVSNSPSSDDVKSE